MRKWWALALLVLLIASTAGWLAYQVWHEMQIAERLAPQHIAQAFQKAGYQIDSIKPIDDYPGPMRSAPSGIEFSTYTRNETVHVFAARYASWQEAEASAAAVNALNRRTQGHYAYAHRRVAIVLVVFTNNASTASEFYAVLKAAVP